MGQGNTGYSFREQGGRQYQSLALELVAPWRCQLRCKNCYKGETHRGRNGNLPTEFVRRVLTESREAGFSEAVFMGGEPTLHPELPRCVAMARELGLVPLVVTNGLRLADSDYVKDVAKPGTTLVLHGLLPDEVQDEEVQFSGYAAKLRQAYANVRGLPEVTVVAEVVAIREFLPHIPAMHRWCQEQGVMPFVEFNRFADNGQGYEGAASPEEVHELFRQLQKTDPNPPEVLLPPAYGQTCTMSITGLHIKNFGAGNYGQVYSCCAQSVCHGDLRQQSLVEVLADPSIAVFKDQDQWIYGPCRQCLHYPQCRGGCRGQAYQVFGCPRASSPFCWHLSPGIRENPKVMMPETCEGCPLQGNPACHPRR